MNHRPMVRTGSDPKFYGNSLVFATQKEAQWSADELSMRWMLVVETGTEPTENPVTHRINFETHTMEAVTYETQGG